MTILTPVLWIAFGALQVLAFTAGMNIWVETHAIVALLLFAGLLTIPAPYVGLLLTTAVAVVGASGAWGWPLWQTYAGLIPFVALSVMVMGVSGTFDVLTARPVIALEPAEKPTSDVEAEQGDAADRLDRDWRPTAERPPVKTNPFADAFAEMTRRDYADRMLRPMAEANLPGPQYRLATIFAEADDGGEALWWFRRAGELGHADAQYSLGALLETRAKSADDNTAAIAWTRSAAELGHPGAQSSLARKYANGMGVPLDKAAAVEWYGKAAAAGHLDSQIQLGLAYMKGDGVRQNTIVGLSWLESAARGDDEDAARKRDTARDGLEEDRVTQALEMSAEHPPPRPREGSPTSSADGPMLDAALGSAAAAYAEGSFVTARRLLAPLVAAEYSPALFALGQMDKAGEGGPVAGERAVILFCRAGAAGHVRAQYEAGLAYLRGDGIAAERETALGWFRAAAEQGYPPAQRALADELDRGGRGAKAEATLWYGFAAAQGDPDAQYSLALALARGDGVPQDDPKALKWYRRASRQGHAQAQADLGFMHVMGQGAAVDRDEGERWLRRAADQGHPGARYSLGILGVLTRREARDDKATAA